MFEDEKENRVRDIDLGEWLGLDRPRDIRQTVERNLEEIQAHGDLRFQTAHSERSGGRGAIEVCEYWLNEAQALTVCALSRTERAKTDAKHTVSPAHARTRLAVGERRLRDLVNQGRLTSIGYGQQKRITQESLEKELSRKKPELLATNSGNCQESQIDGRSDTQDNGLMHYTSLTNSRFPQSEPSETESLLTLTRAANTLGLSEKLVRQLVATGRLPSILVGSRHRVNSQVVRRFMRGEI